ncbi:pirin family protein [Flavobacterium hauense]
MIKQNPAQIFKAHTRSRSENEAHRIHSTLNFKEYSETSGYPFSPLTLLNDETLDANNSIERQLHSGTVVMVIPLVGAAECRFSGDKSQIVVPGEALTYYKSEATAISIKNPYQDSLINFLYITFSVNIKTDILLPDNYLITQADLMVKNSFHKLFESFEDCLSSHLGVFDARNEMTYKPVATTNGIFAFVISGTFEIQGQLIEERDGLALWDTPEIDIEAFSGNAILLLIEAPFKEFQ